MDAYERPSCTNFCVGRRQVCRKTGREARADLNARVARKFDSDCSLQIQAPGRPRPSRSEQIGPYNARSRPFVNVANSLTSPQIPREAAHKRTHSWPDDEEEHRQQHSDRHASDVDAVLPIAPPARESNVTRRPRARRDVVPRDRVCSMAWNFRKGPRTDFSEIMVEFHTVVRYKSRPPVGASGSNSIFGAV